jgi:hypothetical protein
VKYALDVCLAAIMAPFLCLFIYGAIYWEPIHPCGNGQFCGKSHRLYTEEQFKAFLHWEGSFLISFPPGMVASYVLGRRRRRRKIEAWDRLRLLQPTLSPEIEEQRYAAIWKGVRRREFISSTLIGSAVLCTVAAFVLRSIPESPILLELSLFLFLLGFGFDIWSWFFRCPRCGNWHAMNRSPQKNQICAYCGLRRGATFEGGLAELGENG